MFSSAVEDYLKQILALGNREDRTVVPMGSLARALEIAPGTATAMIKSLAEQGLVDYQPRRGAALTSEGRAVAVQVLRRHRIVEYFLAETLGMDWAEIHEEAERLEHAISNRVIDRIDAFLGHPKVDPHGDQIPGADGQMRSRKLRSLNSVAPGQRATVAQIRDQNAEFLDFVSEQGIRPGNDLSVEDKNPHSDALILRMRGRPSSFALGSQAAEKILVEPK